MPNSTTLQGTESESRGRMQDSHLGKQVDKLSYALDIAMNSSVQTPYGTVPLTSALASNDIQIVKPAIMLLNNLKRKMEPILTSDQRFPGAVNYILKTESGRKGIYPANCLEALLHRAKASGCTSEAITWLQRVIAADNSNVLLIETLWGLSIHEPLQLTEAIQLLPIAQLPESAQKKFFTPGADRGIKRSWTVPRIVSDAPGGALVGTLKLQHAVQKYEIGQKHWDELAHDRDAIAALKKEFHDISLIMTLAGPSPVIGTAIWMEYEDPDLKFYGDFLSAWGTRSIEVVPLTGQCRDSKDAVKIPAMLSEFHRLDAKTKLQIRVALERFNLALRRGSLGDIAIDLAIALESLTGGNETNEVTHKVTARTTRMLGGDANERNRIRDIVKATYHYRSSMVHNGQQPKDSRKICGLKVDARVILTQAFSICADLIKTILHNGTIPDWSEFDISH